MKSSKKKKRTSFKRKSSKKGAEVRDREQDLVLEGQRVWEARALCRVCAEVKESEVEGGCWGKEEPWGWLKISEDGTEMRKAWQVSYACWQGKSQL